MNELSGVFINIPNIYFQGHKKVEGIIFLFFLMMGVLHASLVYALNRNPSKLDANGMLVTVGGNGCKLSNDCFAMHVV